MKISEDAQVVLIDLDKTFATVDQSTCKNSICTQSAISDKQIRGPVR